MNREVNQEVYEAFTRSRVKRWEVAQILGVAENTVIRWLRAELPPERKAAILDAIEKVRDAS